MPIVIRCGGCGYVFVKGDFKEVLKVIGKDSNGRVRRMSLWDVAENVVKENNGKCPRCGKELMVPRSIEVKASK